MAARLPEAAKRAATGRPQPSQEDRRLIAAFRALVIAAFSLGVALLVGLSNSPAQAQTQDMPFLPASPFNYADVQLPSHYLENGFGESVRFQNAAIDNDNTPADNPTTDNGATLGRVLFYDNKLSANESTSCSSCHGQATGFASPVTVGFEGVSTRRHTMSLTNARFYERGRFFWDERAETLEDQVIQPFQDPIEMGLSLEELLSKIESQDYYGTLFTNAFGDPEPTPERISQALAQFVRSLISIDARYDEGRAMVSSPFVAFENFTQLENDGKSIFFTTGCSSCHVSEAFVNVADGPTNNGLDGESTDDLGTFETFQDPEFLGSFKVPSLRNVEVTGPFMHDGRFESLEEVVEHYSSGVRHDHPNLGLPLVEPEGRQDFDKFGGYQKSALVAFLKTLTDDELLTAERFSDPFIARPDRAPVIAQASPQEGDAGDGINLGPGIYVAVVAAILLLFTAFKVASERSKT